MDIFNSIKNFIKNDIIGVQNNTPIKPAIKTKKTKKTEKPNNAIIKCKDTGKNIDTITINKKTNAQKTNKPSIGQIRENIKQKCQANNINFAKVLRNLPQVAGLTKEKFDVLPEYQKEEVMLFLEKEIDRAIALQKKHGRSNKTSTEEVITISAKTKYKAKKVGVDLNTIEKETGDVNAELGKDFKKLSLKEKRARFIKMAKARKEAFERRLKARLAEVSPRYRAKVEAEMRAQEDFVNNTRFNEILATNDSDTALEALSTLPAKSMATGMKTILETRCDKAEKTATADKANFEYTENLMKDYYELGDKPSKEVLEEYTQVNVAAKSAQAVIEYQNDYKARRDAYESGEDVPPYLDKEFFTSTAKGIGQGALDNTNMTNDEKAKFISDWKDDAKKYDDYKDVTQNIDEKLENNPEYKEIASKVKTISEEKAHAKSTNIPKDDVPQSEISKKSRETESVVTPPSASTPQSIKTKTTKIDKKDEKLNTVSNPTKKITTHNPILITKEIKTIGIPESIKKFGNAAVIETILDNQNLKHMRPQLTTIIKGYDLNSLKQLAKDCSTNSFLYICSIVNKDYVKELEDVRNDLCYSDRKQLEYMKEQYA